MIAGFRAVFASTTGDLLLHSRLFGLSASVAPAHHAIDAVVIAMTDGKRLQRSATLAREQEEAWTRSDRWPKRKPVEPPWGTTREQVTQIGLLPPGDETRADCGIAWLPAAWRTNQYNWRVFWVSWPGGSRFTSQPLGKNLACFAKKHIKLAPSEK
jgi:hypothetical protein